ncbi:hypothetical protein JNO04_06135 [Halomonas sp. MC140]|nr:hypothetical protein [Halomonas sp. MC140]MDN7131929.1 hypothetical protein [Halomonas sp. MC140]
MAAPLATVAFASSVNILVPCRGVNGVVDVAKLRVMEHYALAGIGNAYRQ